MSMHGIVQTCVCAHVCVRMCAHVCMYVYLCFTIDTISISTAVATIKCLAGNNDYL